MLFIPYTQTNGTLYIEFQYCRQGGPAKKYKCREADSLYVDMGESEKFFEGYAKYIESPTKPKKFDPYGANYYDKKLAEGILRGIKADQPKDWRVLAQWLEQAADCCIGFYILGI